ncbi:MAG: hypothetical protein QMD17_10025 [Rhodocyclaceae bacterium]|nr:hypothetical protein [Rhodocyclaceae bacterium]
MEKSAVFVKSAKGQDAIKTHSREISMNDRHILIMVDGKRNVETLLKDAAIFRDVEATLERLFEAGYIDPIGGAVSRASAAAPRAAAAPGGALNRETKALIEQELVEFLGPIASLLCEETLATAKSLDEALSALGSQMDPQQAVQFKKKVAERLARS